MHDGAAVVAALITQHTLVVSIDGHSAAGKSTLAAELATRVDAIVVHGDDFYRVMDPAARAALGPEEGAARYYDWQRLRTEVLEPLRSGRRATFRRYDWERNELHGEVTALEPGRTVVLEGLFSSRPELADLVDVTVYVDAPAELRRARQLARRDSTSWLDRWDAAEQWYFEHVRPREAFDVVVTGDPA